jgi:hypothetical protein
MMMMQVVLIIAQACKGVSLTNFGLVVDGRIVVSDCHSNKS